MIRSRVSWALWLLAIFIYNLLVHSGAALFLLVASVIIPLVFILLNQARRICISVTLELPDVAEKGDTIEGTFTVYNPAIFPYSKAVSVLLCENGLIGEKTKAKLEFQTGIRKHMKYSLSYVCKYCGRVDFRAVETRLYDIFGLTYKKGRLDCKGSVVVYPDLFVPEITIGSSSGIIGDDIKYSESKRGFDLSEPFGIRDYSPGDSIKSIHWKLTQKFDHIIVKEPGLPIPNSVVLLFETGYLPGKPSSPEIRDAMAQAILSLSRALIASNVSHAVGWQNQKNGLFENYDVETEEDSVWILSKLLSTRTKPDKLSCPEHYLAAFGHFPFAHAVYISSYLKEIDDTSLSLTTMLCLEDDSVQAGDADNGRGQILFTPGNIVQDLATVII